MKLLTFVLLTDLALICTPLSARNCPPIVVPPVISGFDPVVVRIADQVSEIARRQGDDCPRGNTGAEVQAVPADPTLGVSDDLERAKLREIEEDYQPAGE